MKCPLHDRDGTLYPPYLYNYVYRADRGGRSPWKATIQVGSPPPDRVREGECRVSRLLLAVTWTLKKRVVCQLAMMVVATS